MAQQIRVLPQNKLCIVYYTGMLTPSDLNGLWPAIQLAPGYAPEFDELIVYGPDAGMAHIDFELAKQQADLLLLNAKIPAGQVKRRAMLSSNAMQGVLGRMFLAFIRSLAPPSFEIECFDDLATALAWIEAGKGKARPLDRTAVLRTLAELEQANFRWPGARESA